MIFEREPGSRARILASPLYPYAKDVQIFAFKFDINATLLKLADLVAPHPLSSPGLPSCSIFERDCRSLCSEFDHFWPDRGNSFQQRFWYARKKRQLNSASVRTVDQGEGIFDDGELVVSETTNGSEGGE